MMILYSHNNMSFIISFFISINSISISVNNSYFATVFFKAACQANPGAEINFAGSN